MEPRRLPWVWGEPVTPTVNPPANTKLATRAIRAEAKPEALYLWLCQLRRAPYSYDLIDNFGRRSPRTADSALQELEAGQKFMTIFTLVDFVPNHELTLKMQQGWPTNIFGAITLRYRIDEFPKGETRLVAQLTMPRIPGPLGNARRYLLAWGDVWMMRKQLHTLTSLAASQT